MSAETQNHLGHLPSHLVLHEQPHYSDYSRKDYATLDAHLVLHHVPGQSGGRRPRVGGWRRGGRRRLGRRDRLAQPPIAVVVTVRVTPPAVRATVPRALALVALARMLARAYACVRQEPAAAHRARALLSHSAAQDRRVGSPMAVGHFCRANLGQFW